VSNVVILFRVPLEHAPQVMKALRDSAGVAAVLGEREKMAVLNVTAKNFQAQIDIVCGRELAADSPSDTENVPVPA
jgi:hypothetical protein